MLETSKELTLGCAEDNCCHCQKAHPQRIWSRKIQCQKYVLEFRLGNLGKMAEILAEQYRSIYSQPQYPDAHPHDLFPTEPVGRCSITRITFSDEELEAAVNDLSVNSAAGPDGFAAILLKKCRRVLAPPLTAFGENHLMEGSVPLNCESECITPIYKGKS